MDFIIEHNSKPYSQWFWRAYTGTGTEIRLSWYTPMACEADYKVKDIKIELYVSGGHVSVMFLDKICTMIQEAKRYRKIALEELEQAGEMVSSNPEPVVTIIRTIAELPYHIRFGTRKNKTMTSVWIHYPDGTKEKVGEIAGKSNRYTWKHTLMDEDEQPIKSESENRAYLDLKLDYMSRLIAKEDEEDEEEETEDED